MKDKVQNPENYQDSRVGHIPENQKIESLYTDSNYIRTLNIDEPLARRAHPLKGTVSRKKYSPSPF
jgi:hypothetical protein